MHNQNACSPYSRGGFGAGQLQSSAGSFASMYSSEKLQSLSGNCRGGGAGGVWLYQFSDSGAQYDSYLQKHPDMVNRHNMCLTHLLETSKEVDALQQENGQLRGVNKELQKQLDQIAIQASLENRFGGGGGGSAGQSPTAAFDHLVHAFRGFQIGDGKENCADWNSNMNNKEMQEASDASPTSVIENNVEVERYSLPKSISVKSNGYLKLALPAPACRTKGATRPRASPTPTDTVQKVYVRGGQKEEEPLEMVVYNQGMFKTELCNKWQETGACPYGDHCQYAHGIGELHLVIRHPRYKTEQKVYVRGGQKEEEPLEMVVHNQRMFETELCNKWRETGTCPYGDHCQYAHGIGELRPVISYPRYKTEGVALSTYSTRKEGTKHQTGTLKPQKFQSNPGKGERKDKKGYKRDLHQPKPKRGLKMAREPKKLALIVGISYPGKETALTFSLREIKSIKLILTDGGFGFNKENITLLSDDQSRSKAIKKPTAFRIQKALTRLVKDGSVTGDQLFVHLLCHAELGLTPEEVLKEPYVIGADQKPVPASFFGWLFGQVERGVVLTWIMNFCFPGQLFRAALDSMENECKGQVVAYALSGDNNSNQGEFFNKICFQKSRLFKASKGERHEVVKNLWKDAMGVEGENLYTIPSVLPTSATFLPDLPLN